MTENSTNQDESFPDEHAIGELLAAAQLPREHSLTKLDGGSNNRTYCVQAGESRTVLKWYFAHPDDERDRLGAEFGFCRFAWNRGIRSISQPLVYDARNRLSLFSFVDGRRLDVDEITADRVNSALAFLADLNSHREDPEAQQLPAASEACFGMNDHLELVESRVRALTNIPGESESQIAARRFIAEELLPSWQQIREIVVKTASSDGSPLESHLPQEERCLSPSDFGFHNALLTPEGSLSFLDFEYAGWDDPAKLVCDFFCQVQRPVPWKFWSRMTDAVCRLSANAEAAERRVRLLLPVYRLKWCCILLNEFRPTDGARRIFSEPAEDSEKRRQEQLGKAKRYFEEHLLGKIE